MRNLIAESLTEGPHPETSVTIGGAHGSWVNVHDSFQFILNELGQTARTSKCRIGLYSNKGKKHHLQQYNGTRQIPYKQGYYDYYCREYKSNEIGIAGVRKSSRYKSHFTNLPSTSP